MTGFSGPATGNATHGWGRVNAFEAVRLVAPAAQGGRSGVDLMVRDNRLDWGNTEQASNVLQQPTRGFIPHWESEWAMFWRAHVDDVVPAQARGCHCVVLVESAGKAVQKSAGSAGRAVPTCDQCTFTTAAPAVTGPRLRTRTYTRFTSPGRGAHRPCRSA